VQFADKGARFIDAPVARTRAAIEPGLGDQYHPVISQLISQLFGPRP
jgi:hypothetical protein